MPESTNNPEVCTELFNKLYDDTFCEMRKLVAVKCADPSFIQDILQDIYLDYYLLLLQKGEEYAQNSRALLYKIAKRKIFRYYSLKEKMKLFVSLSSCGDDDGDDIPDSAQNTEDEALTKAESDRLWNILSTYPPDIRKIFHLYYCEDMSLPEIARATRKTLSTVKNKLYRTIKELSAKGEQS